MDVRPDTQLFNPHWFESPAIRIAGFGKRPSTLREWLRCAWNMDILFGPVPSIKLIAVISWVIAYLS